MMDYVTLAALSVLVALAFIVESVWVRRRIAGLNQRLDEHQSSLQMHDRNYEGRLCVQLSHTMLYDKPESAVHVPVLRPVIDRPEVGMGRDYTVRSYTFPEAPVWKPKETP